MFMRCSILQVLSEQQKLGGTSVDFLTEMSLVLSPLLFFLPCSRSGCGIVFKCKVQYSEHIY
jgi:hypothetical protein